MRNVKALLSSPLAPAIWNWIKWCFQGASHIESRRVCPLSLVNGNYRIDVLTLSSLTGWSRGAEAGALSKDSKGGINACTGEVSAHRLAV